MKKDPSCLSQNLKEISEDCVCRIENQVESYALELGSQKPNPGRSIGESTSSGNVPKEQLETTLGELGEDVNRDCEIDQVQQDPESDKAVETIEDPFDGYNDVVGLEEATSQLVKVLVGEDSEVVVASICGVSGTGKTTLAKEVYYHHEVRRRFEGFAFVNVGSSRAIREILEGILCQLSPTTKRKTSLSRQKLAQETRRVLKAKNCLVVLDDFSVKEYLKTLRNAFPLAENASKFIITTRSRDLALRVSGGQAWGFIWDMQPLKDEECWELYCLSYNDGDIGAPIPEHSAVARQEIITRCERIPWAIISDARKSKTGKLAEYFRSTYHHLPSHLKSCFLYLGNFPKHLTIQVDKLCQLWIAEGLISVESRQGEETLLDVAIGYLRQLEKRRLVTLQEDEWSSGGLMSCHIHGLIRDFCKLREKEENFFEVKDYLNWGIVKSERCAVHLDSSEVPMYWISFWVRLRSLLFFNVDQSGQRIDWHHKLLSSSITFRLLGVLYLDGVSFPDGKFPDRVVKLIHLRYLSLSECWLNDLPSDVGNLTDLETLDLRVKKECKMTIANVIGKLKKLKYLYLPQAFQTSGGHGRLKLDGLKELEILEGMDTNVCSVEDLENCTNLRHLAASSEGNPNYLLQIVKYIGKNFKNSRRFRWTLLDIKKFDCYSGKRLSFIEKLFKCTGLDALRMQGHIAEIPEIDAKTTRFTEIVLNGCELDQDPMVALEKLPKLRILVLEVEAYVGKQMHCSTIGFPELRCLKLSRLYKLQAWKVDKGALHKLSTLEISGCRRMTKLPEGLQDINTLRKLKISMMPEQFVGRLRTVDGKGGEDLHRINSQCTVEFGSEDPWLKSTESSSSTTNTESSQVVLPPIQIQVALPPIQSLPPIQNQVVLLPIQSQVVLPPIQSQAINSTTNTESNTNTESSSSTTNTGSSSSTTNECERDVYLT